MTCPGLTSFGLARAQGGETIKIRAVIAHQAAEVSANKTRFFSTVRNSSS